MKIWIDVTNSPHVNFFSEMITDLGRKHEIIITARPLANTVELLDLHRLSYSIVGGHYGQNSVKKGVGFFLRTLQLYSFLRDRDIDVAISHSSFYSPVVARMLGVPSIYLNDNEHAAGNYVSFLSATSVLIPEFLDRSKVRRQWASEEKILVYPGVKEGVYLWNYSPAATSALKIDNPQKRPVLFVRPEPWTAQYYSGACCFMDELLTGVRERFKVVLLPRGKVQDEYYRQEKFKGVTIPHGSVSLADIMEICDIFVGAGGTMTREAAVLGIPTISVYQDDLLDVDRYLIECGCMVHDTKPTPQKVIDFYDRSSRRPAEKLLLEKGRRAYDLIVKTLLALPTVSKGVKNA